jgi:hypothetical protein
MALSGWFAVTGACEPAGDYSRGTSGLGGSDEGGGNGGDSNVGSGGMMGDGGSGGLIASGGTAGSTTTGPGGMGGSTTSTGGAAGRGTAGSGVAGSGSAGRGSGGVAGAGGVSVGTGGVGTGGAATGGAGMGGVVGTGGRGTGGAGTGGAGTGGVAAVQILSIDFVGGVVVTSAGGAGGRTVMVTPTPMAATEVAGVKPAANWNSAPGAVSASALTPLLLGNGTSTAASLTWNASSTSTSPGVYSAGLPDAPGDVRMMNGYLDPAMGSLPSATITVSGLPAAATTGGYDVYVYFLAALNTNETRSHKYTIGATTITVSQTGPTTFTGYAQTADMGTTGNYVVFKNVTSASFTLTATAVTGTTKRAPVNGLQIVWPTGS